MEKRVKMVPHEENDMNQTCYDEVRAKARTEGRSPVRSGGTFGTVPQHAVLLQSPLGQLVVPPFEPPVAVFGAQQRLQLVEDAGAVGLGHEALRAAAAL